MKRFTGLFIALMLIGANLIAQDAPIRITASTGYMLKDPSYANLGIYTYIDIVSVSDKITIYKIDVNKGNCKIFTIMGRNFSQSPRNLSYGKKISIMLVPSCNLLRVDVSTDQGDWSVEY